MNQTWKNDTKPNFGPPLPPKGKQLMNQTWEKGKKPNFVPDFGLLGQISARNLFIFFLQVLPLLVVRHCSKLLPYAV